MDKLERYIDQVCQSIGGPFELRQHVRQELREHLLDAVAQHQAAGMTEADAINKAIEEFGQPEEVRSELESAYGKRTVWIVDRAMQWKERTMKAKWLWTTWAYLALIAVITLEVLFLTFVGLFIIPKFKRLLMDGVIDAAELQDQGVYWMVRFLDDLWHVGKFAGLLILALLVLWGLFEWRVKSDNKVFMRLSALGTAAVGLMAVVVLTAVSVIIPFALALPAMGIMARPWAVERVADIDQAIIALEKAQAKKDWPAMQAEANKLGRFVHLLAIGPGPTSLAPPNDPNKAEQMRGCVRAMQNAANDVQESIRNHDEKRLNQALQEFQKAIAPVLEAVERQRPDANVKADKPKKKTP